MRERIPYKGYLYSRDMDSPKKSRHVFSRKGIDPTTKKKVLLTLSQVVYKEHHGEVPPGCVVVVLDPSKPVTDPENLTIMTRREALERARSEQYKRAMIETCECCRKPYLKKTKRSLICPACRKENPRWRGNGQLIRKVKSATGERAERGGTPRKN